MQVSRLKIWCQLCSAEIFPDCNIPYWNLGQGIAKLKQRRTLANQTPNALSEIAGKAEPPSNVQIVHARPDQFVVADESG